MFYWIASAQFFVPSVQVLSHCKFKRL